MKKIINIAIQAKADFIKKRMALKHRAIHNDNALFYTLSPSLLIAILKVFNIQGKSREPIKGGSYYEFGVFRGFSIWFAEQVAREYSASDSYFYGFDSFEGLPKTRIDADLANWAEGNYAAPYEFVISKLKENGTDFSRVKLYKGFFSKSFFSDLKSREKFMPVSICVIDSDIYESCAEVLNFIKDFLVAGSILIFDDYNAFGKSSDHGERRALIEFERQHPEFHKEHLFSYGSYGEAFRVVNI